jgi:hypothetical protein
VREADGGDAVDFLEVQLDELPRGAVVPDPGEREARRRVDLDVVAPAAVLAGPRVEDRVGGRLVGTLNAQRRGVAHGRERR